MDTAWNQPTPIADLFEKLRVGKKISTEGGDTPYDPQFFCLEYNIIQKTGWFETTCCEWRDKPMSQKTINNLKYNFNKWDKDRILNEISRISDDHRAHHVETITPLPAPPSKELLEMYANI